MRKKELNLIVTLVSITVVLVSGCSRVGNSNGIVENKNTLVKKELVYAATTELGDINVHLYAG
ncbi:MAG: hypothetical protein LBD93_02605 [Treponema sp.]|jgi:hypothetical protein|nr:hypothetical protein [Treponema sp.]